MRNGFTRKIQLVITVEKKQKSSKKAFVTNARWMAIDHDHGE